MKRSAHVTLLLAASLVVVGCRDRVVVSTTETTSAAVELPLVTVPTASAPEPGPFVSTTDVPSPAAPMESSSAPEAVDLGNESMTSSGEPTTPASPSASEVGEPPSRVTPGWTDPNVIDESASGATILTAPTPGWTNGAGVTNDSVAGATVGVGPTPGWTNGARVTNGSTSGATVPPPAR
jgi:hypothetical protein